MQFTCSTCGKRHDAASVSFGANEPDQWLRVSEQDRQRSELSSDQCILVTDEGTHFFVRACLDLPIRGTTTSFSWGVWVSLSEKNFDEVHEHWTDPERERLGPYFGWLCTRLPGYPDTMFLKTMLHQRPVGTRPQIILEPTDHPLAVEQRDGIEPAVLQQMIGELLHA